MRDSFDQRSKRFSSYTRDRDPTNVEHCHFRAKFWPVGLRHALHLPGNLRVCPSNETLKKVASSSRSPLKLRDRDSTVFHHEETGTSRGTSRFRQFEAHKEVSRCPRGSARARIFLHHRTRTKSRFLRAVGKSEQWLSVDRISRSSARSRPFLYRSAVECAPS